MGRTPVTIRAARITSAAIIFAAIIGGAVLYFNSNNTAHNGQLESSRSENNSTEVGSATVMDKSFSTGRYTPKNILNAIAEVPPLHQRDIRKDFIGTKVRWKGTIFMLERASDLVFCLVEDTNLVLLSLRVDKVLVSFELSLKDYPNLTLLRADDTMIVEGTIGNFRSGIIGIADPIVEF